MPTSILIGIAGGTGSGKTTVAEKIVEEISSDDVVIIPQDAYYFDRSHLPMVERERINYDHPSAFNTSLLIQHLKDLKRGRSIPKFIYDYVTHSRHEMKERISPKEVAIVEGILVLDNEELRNLLDIKIYVDTDADVRIIRRLERDILERKRSFESVTRQYLESVRPMHLEFIEPSKRYADVIIPEGGWNVVAVDMVVTKINSILRRKTSNH